MTFRDHFSSASPAYAAFRPTYPAELFRMLAERAPGRRLAWDCATGSGQAALGLAGQFKRVVATDASRAQVASATPHPAVAYRVAPAEASGLADGTVDLVTAAQALHWFDIPGFFAEARRVLVPRGAIAVWCYGLMTISPEVDREVARFYSETVGPYWPTERALVEAGYRTIDFPFEEFPVPEMAIEAQFDLRRLAGYLGTWSATLRFREDQGADPVGPLIDSLRSLWGPSEQGRAVRWPLSIRAGYA